MQYIIFDLEATCWQGNQAGRRQEIIEIGAIKFNPFGVAQSQFERFVKPVENPVLSVYCKRLTGIEQHEVDSAGTFPRVIRAFMDWIDIDNSYLLCSWGGKDLELLEDDCEAHGIETWWLDSYIDLKDQYHRIQGLSKKRGLVRTLAAENLDFNGQHHRAMDDARNLSLLFTRYIDEWQY